MKSSTISKINYVRTSWRKAGQVLDLIRGQKANKAIGLLTFANKADYDLIKEDDTFDLTGLTTFSHDKPLSLTIKHANGSSDTIQVNHTYNESQFEWYKNGGALNLIRKQNN